MREWCFGCRRRLSRGPFSCRFPAHLTTLSHRGRSPGSPLQFPHRTLSSAHPCCLSTASSALSLRFRGSCKAHDRHNSMPRLSTRISDWQMSQQIFPENYWTHLSKTKLHILLISCLFKWINQISAISLLLLMPSVLWSCWLGGRKGIQPVKNWIVGCYMVICLQRGADLHMAQLMSLPLSLLLQ